MNRKQNWMISACEDLFSDLSGIIFNPQNKMPSTVIRSIAYNETSAVLTIVFVTGSVYEYFDVPADVYEQFRKFREKGVFYNEQIKGKYRFARVS
jgi:hypothetical protein